MNEYKVEGMTFRYKPPSSNSKDSKKESKKSSKKESKKDPSEKSSSKSEDNKKLFLDFVQDNNLSQEYLEAKRSRTLTKFKQKYAADFMNWKYKQGHSKREPSKFQIHMAKEKANYTPEDWKTRGYGRSYADFYNDKANAEEKQKALKNCRLAPICKGKTWYEMKNNP